MLNLQRPFEQLMKETQKSQKLHRIHRKHPSFFFEFFLWFLRNFCAFCVPLLQHVACAPSSQELTYAAP